MFKYISKAHLIVLVILVVIVGAMLLTGEHLSEQGFGTRTIDTPSSTSVGVEEESLLYGEAQPQEQLMQSDSFVIRPGQKRLGYSEALGLYKNSILQFSEECQLATGDRSFSLNNEIMIDNRSSKPNTFAIGSASVVVGPYDFGFLILREKGVAIPVDCGIRRNVGTLSVQ
jgi:hypothetical protein